MTPILRRSTPERSASPWTAFHRVLAACLLLALPLVAAGCKSGDAVDPILRLSSGESLEQGKVLLADGKYARARDYLTHAFEVSPNSAEGREALLLVADSFYLDGGRSNYIQAEAKYRDFLNRFPTSDRAAYVQFQVANSLAQRMGRPDRDLSATEEALTAYEDLMRLYPTSEYAAQAREKIRVVRENLAAHEMMVGQFYLDYRLPGAAVERFEYLLENYPAYSEKDKALFKLGVARLEARRGAAAREAFDRLGREFPDSPWVSQIPEIPEDLEEAEEQESPLDEGTPSSDDQETPQ